MTMRRLVSSAWLDMGRMIWHGMVGAKKDITDGVAMITVYLD
jgi:hypothetical protein